MTTASRIIAALCLIFGFALGVAAMQFTRPGRFEKVNAELHEQLEFHKKRIAELEAERRQNKDTAGAQK